MGPEGRFTAVRVTVPKYRKFPFSARRTQRKPMYGTNISGLLVSSLKYRFAYIPEAIFAPILETGHNASKLRPNLNMLY